jgi:hypothetical protein
MFKTERAAARAFDRKAVELRGKDAKTNFPIKNYLHLLKTEK